MLETGDAGAQVMHVRHAQRRKLDLLHRPLMSSCHPHAGHGRDVTGIDGVKPACWDRKERAVSDGLDSMQRLAQVIRQECELSEAVACNVVSERLGVAD